MKRQKENSKLLQRQQLQEAVAAPKNWAQKGKGLESSLAKANKNEK